MSDGNWRESDYGREIIRKAVAKYQATDKGKQAVRQAQKRYFATELGRLARDEAHQRYQEKKRREREEQLNQFALHGVEDETQFILEQ